MHNTVIYTKLTMVIMEIQADNKNSTKKLSFSKVQKGILVYRYLYRYIGHTKDIYCDQAFHFSLNSTSCTRFKALQISFFIFVVKDQGHDHLHHGDRDRGHGEVG